MAIRRRGRFVLRQIETLFNVGTIGDLTGGQFFERSVLTLTREVLRSLLSIRFRWLAVVVLSAGIVCGGAMISLSGFQDSAPTKDQPVAERTTTRAAQAPIGTTSERVTPDDVPLRLTLEEAVKAAGAIEDPAARRSALVRIANAQEYLSDLPAARATARLAHQSAEQIASDMQRHFGLWRVAKLQAKLGDVEPARQTFAQLIKVAATKAPWDRMSLLGSIAVAQNEGGLREDALQTLNRAIDDARKIVAETSKGDIYFNLVFAQCQIGDFDGVLRIVESLQGKLANDRQTYLQYLARDCDKAGPAEARRILAKALELSKAIPYVYPRGLTQKMIAQAMARNGDIPGALAASKLVGQIDDAPAPKGIFSIFESRQAMAKRQGEQMNAEMTRGEIPDVLIAVATAQAKAGDRAAAKNTFGEAMEIIDGERDGVGKTQRLRGFVEALTAAGELIAAKVAIEAIERDEHNKALALVALGKAQARAGDKAGAIASLIAAFESAKEIKARANLINDNVAWNKDEAFRVIARAQVEVGDIAEALVTVSAHDNQSIRAEIQAEVAGFQARQGDVAAAMKTAESIANASSKAEALMRIAHFQSKMGRREAAHDWAAQRGSPQERALALLGVVEGVCAQRRGE
jgi:tetratricopeptide (TPR) repeat protein